jgi:hypothetical protein
MKFVYPFDFFFADAPQNGRIKTVERENARTMSFLSSNGVFSGMTVREMGPKNSIIILLRFRVILYYDTCFIRIFY